MLLLLLFFIIIIIIVLIIIIIIVIINSWHGDNMSFSGNYNHLCFVHLNRLFPPTGCSGYSKCLTTLWDRFFTERDLFVRVNSFCLTKNRVCSEILLLQASLAGFFFFLKKGIILFQIGQWKSDLYSTIVFSYSVSKQILPSTGYLWQHIKLAA